MDKKNLTTIIFDLGGVLLNIDYHLTAKAFENMGVRDFNTLYSQAKQGPLFDLLETGEISNQSFRSQIRKITNIDLRDTEIDSAWNAMLLDFPVQRMELLERLEKKYRLILMSNTNKIHVEAFTKIISSAFGMQRFERVFNKKYYSSSIGRRKPDVATFEWILTTNSLHADECFFIDDSQQHIIGAKKAGIQSHWLQAGEDVISFFDQNNL